MEDFDDISGRILKQLRVFEQNSLLARMKEVDNYINSRLEKVKSLLPNGEEDWARVSEIIDIFGEIQRVIDKVEDMELVIANPPLEVYMDMEKFADEFIPSV